MCTNIVRECEDSRAGALKVALLRIYSVGSKKKRRRKKEGKSSLLLTKALKAPTPYVRIEGAGREGGGEGAFCSTYHREMNLMARWCQLDPYWGSYEGRPGADAARPTPSTASCTSQGKA